MTVIDLTKVAGRWPGETACVIATGASLRQADVDWVRGKARVIAVNKAYLMAPWADVLFSIDRLFWERVNPEFAGEKWTVDGCSAIRSHGLNAIESIKEPGIDPRRLHWTAGSGGTAINLAFVFGANPIILLGFDMKMGLDGETGEERPHFHEDYKHGNPDNQRFGRWKKEAAKMGPGLARAGVRVINCTRDTALDCFERCPLEAVL